MGLTTTTMREALMAMNVYAAILAGGSGTRMGNVDKPKQFQMLGGKPIIIHTIEKFCASGKFDAVVVLSPAEWVRQTSDLIAKHCGEYAEQIRVTAGGARRSDTVNNAIAYVQDNFATDADTVLVTHDAVRPFVSYRMIEDNIAAAREFGACDTVIPATDTIVESLDGSAISTIPERRNLYQGQTPQSFNLAKLAELVGGLSEEESASLTDACKVFVLRGETVALVDGDASNMKITYPQDLRVARAMMADE
jgi:2-C-methyl-D-erythritol 4-phosphate cytidylyltransferase